MAFDYDLYVLGAGSGGVRASRMSAAAGAKVAVAESTYLGGTCVNVGCVPKKLFVYGSHFSEDFEDAAGYGWIPRHFIEEDLAEGTLEILEAETNSWTYYPQLISREGAKLGRAAELFIETLLSA